MLFLTKNSNWSSRLVIFGVFEGKKTFKCIFYRLKSNQCVEYTSSYTKSGNVAQ